MGNAKSINQRVERASKTKSLTLSKVKLKKIPEKVLKLRILHTLNLDENVIKELPDELFSMENLKHFSISHNRCVDYMDCIWCVMCGVWCVVCGSGSGRSRWSTTLFLLSPFLFVPSVPLSQIPLSLSQSPPPSLSPSYTPIHPQPHNFFLSSTKQTDRTPWWVQPPPQTRDH